ncbi:glycosyltransferase [Priestia taiwanensis]|uniref:Glycosyl transferase family 2 n=1 Tax=Priestia taiwanensis TaxID=1347902 RepID=A0A917AYN9_9BACI|nr:glycosyltransferase family 2 protein [Priestia taiwanensis]MBM7364384.1 glycosyltransferase involved in cell wall biosynthesis [Priestia taiwanensis]GGE81810.1 glycosyl transferase family 2 [Priestia taiwanensis]
MRPFISLCMIVKNEEKVLDRCLSTVAHLVDEVIIVDTGSTDNTKEIATQYTKHIYDFEWVHDFSAARNYAAEKATGEWILVLDADEYVEEENFKSFLLELKDDKENFNAYAIMILNFTGVHGERMIQNHHERVYKNDGDIAYTRKIHEQFYSKSNTELRLKKSALTIFHSGYLNATVKEKDKQERNQQLINDEISNKNNIAFDYFNLGNESISKGNIEEALNNYVKAYELKTNFKASWIAYAMVNIVNCLIRLQRYNEALNVIKDAESLYSTAPDFLYLKGTIYKARGQYEDAKEAFNHILNNKDYYINTIFSPDIREVLPHRDIADIYFIEKNYQKAIFHYVSVLNINKQCTTSMRNTLFILNKFHTKEEIVEFVIKNRLVSESNLVSYVRVCFDIGNPRIVEEVVRAIQPNKDTLIHLVKLKELAIYDTGIVNDEIKELIKNISEYSKTALLNIGDYAFIYHILESNNIENEFLQQIFEDEKCKQLKQMLTSHSFEVTDSELLLTALTICLTYRKYEQVNILLNNNKDQQVSISHNIAAILYDNDFRVEAMEYYNDSNWLDMNEQDFLNIINGLFAANDVFNGVQVANYGCTKWPEDFRFYQFIINHSTDEMQIQSTVNQAERLFGKSLILDRFIF